MRWGCGTNPEKGDAPETINQMEVNHESQLG
jgi:hypothetical protein